MKIKYNAPTTLTFSFFCAGIVFLDHFVLHGLTRAFFTVPSAEAFNLLRPINYLRLFTHIAGHADWAHLMTNLAYILLLGPMLEETYGSLTMFLMIMVTGFVTGVLNACFLPHPLLGASGVVFMMILLASFTNHGKNDVPLTFILIVFLYLGREIQEAFKGDDISQFAHLAGGFCGSLFGFFKPNRYAPARVYAHESDKTVVDRPRTRKTATSPTRSNGPQARASTATTKTASPRSAQGTKATPTPAKRPSEKSPSAAAKATPAKKATIKVTKPDAAPKRGTRRPADS